MDKRKQDLSFCWEQILALDPWFRLNFLFAPAELKDAVLALHALFASIDHALRIEEESLIHARLAWLANELTRAPQSEFPVVRLLQESGVIERASKKALSAVIEDAHARIGLARPGSVSEFKARCATTGWTRLAPELGLSHFDQAGGHNPEDDCAGTGAHYLMRVGDRHPAQALGSVPLDVLARHQVSAGAMARSSDAAFAARDDFMKTVIGWTQDQTRMLEDVARRSGGDHSNVQHITALSIVCGQRAQRIRKDDNAELSRWGAGELFRVWGACRRMRSRG